MKPIYHSAISTDHHHSNLLVTSSRHWHSGIWDLLIIWPYPPSSFQSEEEGRSTGYGMGRSRSIHDHSNRERRGAPDMARGGKPCARSSALPTGKEPHGDRGRNRVECLVGFQIPIELAMRARKMRGGGVASKTPQGERGHEETEEARSTEA